MPLSRQQHPTSRSHPATTASCLPVKTPSHRVCGLQTNALAPQPGSCLLPATLIRLAKHKPVSGHYPTLGGARKHCLIAHAAASQAQRKQQHAPPPRPRWAVQQGPKRSSSKVCSTASCRHPKRKNRQHRRCPRRRNKSAAVQAGAVLAQRPQRRPRCSTTHTPETEGWHGFDATHTDTVVVHATKNACSNAAALELDTTALRPSGLGRICAPRRRLSAGGRLRSPTTRASPAIEESDTGRAQPTRAAGVRQTSRGRPPVP